MPSMEEWRSGDGPSLLEQARREDGLSQQELAQRLGVGQPYLSKLLAKKVNPSSQALWRIGQYLNGRPPRMPDSAPDWAKQVVETAAASPDFKELVLAALRISRHQKA